MNFARSSRVQDFVRSGAYRPACRTATFASRSGSQCQVPVDEIFSARPGTSNDLTADDFEAVATVEQYRLFSSYQRKRHEGGEMSEMDFSAYRAMIEDTPVSSRTVNSVARWAPCGMMLMDHVEDSIRCLQLFDNSMTAKPRYP